MRAGSALTPPIMGSSVELMQVLVNFLVNAADASEGKDGEVTLATYEKDGGAVVIVKDNGSGIDPKDVDRIFDPFFTTKPPGRGTGLGLAIARRTVELHGGRLDLITHPDGGAEAQIDLPLSAEE